jgi:MFS family permease
MRKPTRRAIIPPLGMALWAWVVAITQWNNGTIETAWTPHIPEVQQHLHIGLATLGDALSGMPIGLLLGGLLGGPLSKLIGSRSTMVVGGFGFFGAFPVAALAPTPLALWLVLFVGGLGNGLFDTGWALQSTAYEVERARRGHVGHHNQGMQALFSLGSLAGVGSAALGTFLGWRSGNHLLVVCGLALASTVLLARWLPRAPERAALPDDLQGRGPSASATAGSLAFAGLCLASFFVFLPLGAAYAWSKPYLLDLGATTWLATFGLVAYTASEAATRVYFWLRSLSKHEAKRLGPAKVVLIGASIALLGVALVVVPGRVDAAIVGFGLVAFGFGPIGPVLQSAANLSAAAGKKQVRIGLLTTAGYTGGVVGIPLVGWIASASSLRASLCLIALSALVALALAHVVRRLIPDWSTMAD